MFAATHLVGFAAGGDRGFYYVWTAHSVNTANGSVQTFTDMNVGDAAANRKVLIGFGYNVAGSITSVTIGGVTASIVGSIQSSGAGNEQAVFYQADVPTGSTATVVITLSASATDCGLDVWSIYAGAAAATATGGSTGANPASTTLDIPANGVGFAYVYQRSNSGTTFTFSGLTEESGSDEAVEAGGDYHAAASKQFVTAQTGLTVSATASLVDVRNPVMAVCSFGPAS